MLEEREKKRRRHGDTNSSSQVKGSDGDEEEWLLDEQEDDDLPRFSEISKEEISDGNDEDQVKVGIKALCSCMIITNWK